MSSPIRFTKYEKKGPYHWREYVRGHKYRKHAERVRKWVKEEKILDVGAGDGVITFLLRATGIDNEPTAVHIAQTIGVNVIFGEAYNLPFPDNHFDAVTMIDVLEHFDRPQDAIREAKRVAPILYIATPERQPGRRIRDKFHVQEWTREELVDFMKDNGYELTGEILKVNEGDTMYAAFHRNT
jgi:SAM-dependent methyltransferase